MTARSLARLIDRLVCSSVPIPSSSSGRIIKMSCEMRSGRHSEAELETQLAKRGLMNRLLGRFYQNVDAPWKMYPVGFLFGLGFDTATEVASTSTRPGS